MSRTESALILDYRFPINLMPVTKRDHNSVISMLSFLPTYYPDSYSWLHGTLERADSADYDCLKAVGVFNEIAGLLIAKKKYGRSKKICNFYIPAAYRRRQIGSQILNAFCVSNFENGIDNIHITFNDTKSHEMHEFLVLNSFALITKQVGRYYENEAENIYGVTSSSFVPGDS